MKRLILFVLILTSPVAAAGQAKTKGILLEDLTWLEAEKVFTKELDEAAGRHVAW
jgi:hypothetical protein